MTAASRGPYHSPTVAAGYAFARPAVHPRILQHVRQHLGLHAPVSRALDIGCGAGRSTSALGALARHTVGIDSASAMLAHRRIVAPTAQFVIGDAERLPFLDGVFQLITAAGSLNYTDPNVALPEIARVLVRHGTVVIYDFSAGRRFAAGLALEQWYAEFERRFPEAPGYEMDVRDLPFDRAGLVFAAHHPLVIALPMTLDEYLRYVESETRIEVARLAGQADTDIREWCRRTLQAVFGDQPHDVVFDAYTAYATLR